MSLIVTLGGVRRVGRAALTAALAASVLTAAPALAKGPLPTGFHATVVMTATGAECSGTLTVTYNVKGLPINRLVISTSAGTPTPSGVISDFHQTSKKQLTMDFTFALGTSAAYQAQAFGSGFTVQPTISNTLVCPS